MNFHLARTTLLAAAILLPHAVGAQAKNLNLDTAVEQALQNNPHLQAAELDVALAEARLINVGKLSNPELELSLRRSQAEANDREGRVFAGFSQKFPVTDRLKRAKEVRQVDVELAKAEVREAKRRFIGTLQDQFLRALAARAKVVVLGELEESTAQYIALAKRRLEQAQGSELEIASAQTEFILAQQAKTEAEGDYRVQLATLRPLLGLPPETKLQLSGDLNAAVTKLRKSIRLSVPAEIERTDVIAARLRRSRAEAQRKLAYAGRLEDWEVTLGYENERSVDEPIGADRDHFFGIGVRIPLPFRTKGEGPIAVAKAEADKAEKLLEAAKASSRAEVAAEIEAVKTAQAALDSLQGEMLPLLAQREEKTRDAYAQGVIDFTPVLQLQQQRARLRQTVLDRQQAHALALSRLQTALGSHPAL